MEQKNDVIITQARYLASAVRKDQYPEEKKPEFVFIGRSNVGKSSLINSLTRVKNLARVSSQPGKTQTINFYELGAKLPGEEERRSFYLVDLPGYGYAKTGKEKRKLWSAFIEEYLKTSEQLQFVCQLIDIRHAPMASDIEMFQWLVRAGIPVLVIATKADKIGRLAREKQVHVIQKALGVPDLSVLPYSSLKNEGRSELLDVLRDSLLK
ncbi:MAG: ribosome biogenesis GTP-binding protein YihA/YsxC [Selenomonas sp.]|uniref:ribosome biogenesis GTP-binding protein YihA/YsxC n=1 Tax=Selenomonas sp. TaxID=2053611 RepID=UPI0025FC8D08|nr:ribosome biogenesis GTP-binding protein YihA/YsxC [Selenomonas sp.]MCI6233335.1 ribosome biogenesis GTP-binding protein YihA/YsxC [Selenomonas sp.]